MTGFLEAGGGRIAYDLTGEGALVVLAKGMGDNSSATDSLGRNSWPQVSELPLPTFAVSANRALQPGGSPLEE